MADPSDVTFNWIFNNSDENFVVPKDKHALIDATTSKLEYKLTSNRDYGTLSCWAKNSVGMQKKPCTYYVIGAGKHKRMKTSPLSISLDLLAHFSVKLLVYLSLACNKFYNLYQADL